MKRLAALLACALALACGRGSDGTAAYENRSGFSCRVPANWRVQERPDGAAFFGPASGPRPFSASIAVYRYSKAAFASPQAYAALRGGAAKETTLAGRKLLEYETATQKTREHGYLLAAPDGFFALVHAMPPEASAATEPVFKALVESFRFR